MAQNVCHTGIDVCPDLVPLNPYGFHKSFVVGKPGQKERRWYFTETKCMELFLEAVEAGEFRRQSEKEPSE